MPEMSTKNAVSFTSCGANKLNSESSEFRVRWRCDAAEWRRKAAESMSMFESLIDLRAIPNVECIEASLLRRQSPKICWQVVFGRQVVVQAMVSARRALDGSLPHSQRCYSTHSVTATQHGNANCSTVMSLHAKDESTFEHQSETPNLPSSERLLAEGLSKQPQPEKPKIIVSWYAIELRRVEIGPSRSRDRRRSRSYLDQNGREAAGLSAAAHVRGGLCLGVLTACGDGTLWRRHASRQAQDVSNPRADTISPRRVAAPLLQCAEPTGQARPLIQARLHAVGLLHPRRHGLRATLSRHVHTGTSRYYGQMDKQAGADTAAIPRIEPLQQHLPNHGR